MNYYIKLFRTRFKSLDDVKKFIEKNSSIDVMISRGKDSWSGRLPQKKVILLESDKPVFDYKTDDQKFEYIPTQFILERPKSQKFWFYKGKPVQTVNKVNQFECFGGFVLEDDEVDFYVMSQNKDDFSHVLKYQIEEYGFLNGEYDIFSSDCLFWLFKKYKTQKNKLKYLKNSLVISELSGYSGKPTDVTTLVGKGDGVSGLMSTETFLVFEGELTHLNLVFDEKDINVTFSISNEGLYTFDTKRSYGDFLLLNTGILQPILLSIFLAKVIYPSILVNYKKAKTDKKWSFEIKKKYMKKMMNNIIRRLKAIYSEEYESEKID